MFYIRMIAAALLPAVLLLLYIWKKDTQKEPTYMLLKAVAWGIGIIIPVVVVETMIKMMLFGENGTPATLADTTALAFLVAAIPEETFKLLALWMVLKNNPYFDEHFDGIVYAVCVGLGFAAVETYPMCSVRRTGLQLPLLALCWPYQVIMPLLCLWAITILFTTLLIARQRLRFACCWLRYWLTASTML